MPRGDRTGPAGQGPMTGRAAGYCAGYNTPGFMNPGGRYLGTGRGLFGRRGRGMMHRNWFYATGYPGWARYDMGFPAWGTAGMPYPADIDAGEESEFLKEQADYLKQQLDDIQTRMDELEKEKKAEKS